MSVVALGGASCDKKTPAKSGEAQEVVQAMDSVEAQQQQQPVKQEPIPGVDLSDLDANKKDRFYRLVDRGLQSPCGKAHSLRTSLTDDTSCKRAPFAAKYVIAMLADEAGDEDIQRFYNDKYKSAGKVHTFDMDPSSAHTGPPDAPVRLVEFYDYGCGACKQFAPMLKEALSRFPGEVVLYYKQYPLPSHPDSRTAAQAALAALQQDRFDDMHELLFRHAPRHKKSDVDQYAQSLGLDMNKFEADFAAAASLVKSNIEEGNSAGVRGTPTLFVNGSLYTGPTHPAYIQMWIEEELAVNR